jgi:hypothetical protein
MASSADYLNCYKSNNWTYANLVTSFWPSVLVARKYAIFSHEVAKSQSHSKQNQKRMVFCVGRGINSSYIFGAS